MLVQIPKSFYHSGTHLESSFYCGAKTDGVSNHAACGAQRDGNSSPGEVFGGQHQNQGMHVNGVTA